MFVLAVETSTSMGSVALIENGILVGEMILLNRKHHSQMILKMIHSLLKESGVPLGKIDLFSVSVGPGSFTGLRVGVATMKGLATGLGKPLKGVPTLEGFAGQLPYTPYPICPLIPAGKNEVYMALYHYNEDFRLAPLKPAKVIPLSSFWREIKGPVHLLGELPAEWPGNQLENKFYYSPLFRYPRAFSVAQIAYQNFKERRGILEEDPGMIMPEYPSGKNLPDGMLL